MRDNEQLIDAYVVVAENEPGTPAFTENFWAYMAIETLVSEQPLDAYALILQMLAHDLSDRSLAYIAAGPLESLLAKHGRIIIDMLETDARQNPALRHALGGVWQNTMSDDIWQRVSKTACKQW